MTQRLSCNGVLSILRRSSVLLNRNFLCCPDDIISVTDKQQSVSIIPIMQNVCRCFIFAAWHTCFLICQTLCTCIILADSRAHVCDCACVLRKRWRMMLFRCRAHRYICGQGGNVSLHVNEPLCHSCVITARNDTNQPFSPQRQTHAHAHTEVAETVL